MKQQSKKPDATARTTTSCLSETHHSEARSDQESQALHDLIREETSRGRHPVDMEETRRQRQRRTAIMRAIKDGREEKLRAGLIAIGMQKDSEEFKQAMSAFYAYQKKADE